MSRREAFIGFPFFNRKDDFMHFLSLVTMEIPEIIENENTNKEIEVQIEKSKEVQNHILRELMLGKLRSLKSTFSREVTSYINDIMDPYSETPTNQHYLEFIDHTEELEYDYEKGTTDCIRLPNGTLVTENHPSFFKKYVLHQGKVFQRDAGPLHHIKRTKRAKKMRAMLCYPNKKLYPDFQAFADDGWVPFNEEVQKYGYFCNPNAMWDWYSIGGRWADMLLVKNTCKDYVLGEASWTIADKIPPAPDGYMWVSAARKKDIAWKRMHDWEIHTAKEHYQKLKHIFETGICEEDFYGILDDTGISVYGEYVYQKGQSLSSYLKKHTISPKVKYPLPLHDIIDASMWRSCDDISIGKESSDWSEEIDEYIDALSEDTVLACVDYHI